MLSVTLWPAGAPAIGVAITVLAFLPLLLPLPGILKGSPRAYRWAMLGLTPVVALAVMEVVVNAGARARAATTLALVLIALAAMLAALRSPTQR